MNPFGKAGLVGGAVSAAALGALAGVTVGHRPAARRGGRRDRYAKEDFRLMSADRGSIVAAEDGTALAVREVGPADAPLTVVFVHGYCLRMESWHFQRRQLEKRWGKAVRMVFFDQRGHGRSAVPASASCTIGQLGRDLDVILQAVAPRGPVVLVGHSMGGMTILALARQVPELFGTKVIGVGLISTAAEGLNKTGLSRNLQNPVIDAFRLAVRTSPGLVQFGRGAARMLISPILRSASYGTDVSPSLMRFSEWMLNQTSVTTIVNFLKSLELHDESAALPIIAELPSLVLCGDADMILPFSQSEAMAAELPESELVRVVGGGHLVQLEFPIRVTDAIDRLVGRSIAEQGDSERTVVGG
ncbi:alpha/beta hydrolase [Rhodococcus maanshanensis]|uniref:alpha/beta fold hydrolase n=1 Tax=Rhodococcus maanshanensis TaxID=183556 RepID=UPI0022B5CC16|nr:alpha/beta hydrolase [Rhodococcus maanshanensis]MCZ4554822.1 alpha/beta hydrolase [Rhodococcus maanshanensis]